MREASRDFAIQHCLHRRRATLIACAVLVVGLCLPGCLGRQPRIDFSTSIMSYGWETAWVCPVGSEPPDIAAGMESPFLWCWPLAEDGTPKGIAFLTSTGDLRTMELQYNKWTIATVDATVQHRDVTSADLGMLFLAPMWYHAVNERRSTGSLADLMKVEGLGVIGSSVGELEKAYGPISYYRDPGGQMVDVAFTFEGHPVRFRTANEVHGEGGEPRDVTGSDIPSDMSFWENFTPGAFPNSIGKIPTPKH